MTETTPQPAAAARIQTLSLGDRDVHVRGMARSGMQDLYHLSMTMTWPRFYAALAAAFAVLNLAFAVLYSLQPGGIANQSPAGFVGALFFSVETLATVGYGDMHPASLYAHSVATLEIFVGMMSIALMTGVTFARFARPHARIIASRHAVVTRFNGQPTLMVRAANARKSMIVQADARMHLVRQERTAEGHSMRRLHDLKLLRQEHPMFFLSWTLMHVIDDSSPLCGLDAAQLAAQAADIVVTITGLDEVTLQDMRSRHIYRHDEILWNHAFEDMLERAEDGRDVVDYARIHRTRPLAG